MDATENHSSDDNEIMQPRSFYEKSFKAAYELGYYNGYNDATEEEDYNEDFSDYTEFFDEEEDFDLQDYDDFNYGSPDEVKS